MKLVFYRGERPNFGDELNLWIWPQLLGPIFDSDPCQQFLGIGSIIGIHNLPPGSTKIVCGAAFVPEYASSPLLDSSWHIYFVRGPRTASLLNLPSELGVGDPGSLVREILLPGKSLPKTHSVGFMPHWVSANTGNWQEVCAQSGVQYIDPRAPLTEVLEKLRTTETIITEAMHGAIVADALDVPWIPVNPSRRGIGLSGAIGRKQWALNWRCSPRWCRVCRN